MTDKLQIKVDQDRVDPTSITMEKLVEANWTDDPGTGKAILAVDERGAPGYEILNPLPFAPPIGWEPTPPIEELIRLRVHEELTRLKDAEEIDDIIDAEDFDVDDELPPLDTIYEVIAMKPESPSLPKDSEPDLKETAKAQLDFEELVSKERLLRKRHREAALRRQQEEAEALDPPDEPTT